MLVMRRAASIAVVFAVLAALVSFVGAVRTAHAAEIDVPGAFPTIQAALDASAPGDVIVVAPGTYTENVDFHGKDVIVRSSAGPATTRIANAGAVETAVVQIGPGGKLTGFTVSGGSASFGGGMSLNGVGAVIEGNIFSGNRALVGGFGAAIAGNNASATIQRNLFKNNTCDDQYPAGVISFVNESSPYIANNLFADNPCRAINMTLPVPAAPMVVNNTFVRNPVGIHVDARVETFRHVYRNNIIVGNAVGLEVVFANPGNNPTFDHNLVAGNTTNYSGIADQTGTAGNISADPMFQDYSGGDFHLLPASPAIDAGSVLNAPAVDFDGTVRDLAGSTDIGAFEAGGPAPVDVPGTGRCTTTLTGTVRTLVVTSGTTCLNAALVAGGVTVGSGASLVLTNSTVAGALASSGGAAITACNSTFNGPVLVNGSSGFVLLGDGGDGTASCPGNIMRGVVIVGWPGARGANTGGVELGGNTIAGSVIVTNSQAPAGGTPTEDKSTELEGNRIRGSLFCVANTPGPVNGGHANTVAGTTHGQCMGL